MKVGELIELLQKFPADMNVDCNNCHGQYSDIVNVQLQNWKSRENRMYETVTIKHSGYDPENAFSYQQQEAFPEEENDPNAITAVLEPIAEGTKVHIISARHVYVGDYNDSFDRNELRPVFPYKQ